MISHQFTSIDFHKIGGFYILGPCLNSPHSGLRWRCGELIATLTQNNPYCQIAVLSENILPILLKVVEDDGSEKTRVKALYATSCEFRIIVYRTFYGNILMSLLLY